MSLSRQSIALGLTTKNKERKHHIHHKDKRETEKTPLTNKINCVLIRPANGVGPILTALEPAWGTN